jgi:hypothetical protein
MSLVASSELAEAIWNADQQSHSVILTEGFSVHLPVTGDNSKDVSKFLS